MPQTTWIDDVRGVLKREHGKGWSVQQQSGKIKLVRRVPGQSSKQAITTQLPWRASSQTKLLSLVVELRALVLALHSPMLVSKIFWWWSVTK